MLTIDHRRKAIEMMQEPRSQLGGDDAELIAIEALQFLAGRKHDLDRFLALSGVDPGDLRRLAGDTGFLGGILDFLLGNEALLLTFATEAGHPPETIAAVRRRLDAGQPPLESSEDGR